MTNPEAREITDEHLRALMAQVRNEIGERSPVTEAELEDFKRALVALERAVSE